MAEKNNLPEAMRSLYYTDEEYKES